MDQSFTHKDYKRYSLIHTVDIFIPFSLASCLSKLYQQSLCNFSPHKPYRKQNISFPTHLYLVRHFHQRVTARSCFPLLNEPFSHSGDGSLLTLNCTTSTPYSPSEARRNGCFKGASGKGTVLLSLWERCKKALRSLSRSTEWERGPRRSLMVLRRSLSES